MAQDTRTINRPSLAWASGDPCNSDHTNRFSLHNVPGQYESVVSERRVKPKKKIVKPNDFRVEKFNLLHHNSDDHNCVAVEGGNDIVFSNNRALLWPAWNTSLTFTEFPIRPGDLENEYENITMNAIVDVYAKANSPAIFDSAPLIYEMGATLKYIKNAFVGFWNIIKSGKFAKGSWKRIKSPESIWLEYRYAIMPIILTISDAIEAYKGGTCRRTYDARVTVDGIKKKIVLERGYSKYDGVLYDTIHTTDVVSATARLYILSQNDPNPLGFGLWDQLRGAWEALTLSFVLDWFIGVEQWLTSLRDTNLVVEASYVTTVVDR